jgi:hypothetical protein
MSMMSQDSAQEKIRGYESSSSHFGTMSDEQRMVSLFMFMFMSPLTRSSGPAIACTIQIRSLLDDAS